MRSPGALALGDRELHQAQQRAVAALAHELRVERDAPGRAGARRDPAELLLFELGAHGETPGRRHSTPAVLQARFMGDVGAVFADPDGRRRAGGVAFHARDAAAAVRAEQRVADLALGDQVLELGNGREHPATVRGQDQDRSPVLHDQRPDLRRRLGGELVVGALLVRAQVGAEVALLFARQRADVAGVGDVRFDRR